MPLYKRAGLETLVNTETAGDQIVTSIDGLASGGYVVVWKVNDAGGNLGDTDLRAQIFQADGAKVGSEIHVNATTDGTQTSGSVMGLADGRFVVVWSDLEGDDWEAPGSGIEAQIFNADGTKSGSEFLVNTSSAGFQTVPKIGHLSNGGFVIGWTNSDGAGHGDIRAQMFDSAAARVGSEIVIASGSVRAPMLTGLAGGGFAAVWLKPQSVELQFFDTNGAKVGAEHQVNTDPTSSQIQNTFTPDIVQLAGGNLLVVWAHYDSTGTNFIDVAAQLFTAAGDKIGGQFIVNTELLDNQISADAVALPDGGFLVTWQGPGETAENEDIHGRTFAADGTPVGPEFVLNSTLAGDQSGATSAVLSSGDIVTAFTDESGTGADLSGLGVQTQRLTATSTGPTDLSVSHATFPESAREGVPLATLSPDGALNTSYTYQIVSDSSGGAFAVAGNNLIVQDQSLLDFETAPQVSLTVRVIDAEGRSFDKAFSLTVTDTPEVGYAPVGGESLANVTTQDNQGQSTVTALDGGGYLVTWRQWVSGSDGTTGVGRVYDADGHPVTGELPIDAFAAAPLSGGGFVALTDASNKVVGQVYDASGSPVGGSFIVGQGLPMVVDSVAGLTAGGFVVVMHETSSPIGGEYGVLAQIFDGSGAKVGPNIPVTFSDFVPDQVDVAGSSDGGFLVVWSEAGLIEAQRFTNSGSARGSVISIASDSVVEGHVVGLAGGGLVMTWAHASTSGSSSIDQLTGQIYDADGLKVGDSFTISDTGPARVGSTQLAALPWGGFVVTWADYDNASTNDPGIRGAVFDATGAALGGPFIVNTATPGDQYAPDVAVLASGEFVVTWSDASGQGGDASGLGVKLRTYAIDHQPGDIVGTEHGDSLFGGSGSDRMFGLSGDDYLNGGAGADRMVGGQGNDIYVVDNSGDVISETSGEGNDGIYTTLSYALASGTSVETLSTLDWNATSSINLTGNEIGNWLIGNAGTNVLDGGAGADILQGRGGDDVYLVDNAGDLVVENAGEGGDSVYSSVSYALAPGSEVETLSTLDWNATAALNLTGNEFANYLIGNAGVNVLAGGGGADILDAKGGDDVLDGGIGSDVMIGGAGNDTYVVDNVGDIAVEAVGGGTDAVYTSVSYSLTTSQEVETLATLDWNATAPLNLAGNDLANYIIGNAGANQLRGLEGNDVLDAKGGDDLLDGGTGADYMVGGLGNDVYLVDNAGDVVIETAGQGNDGVFATASYALAAGTSVETLSTLDWSGTQAINLTGNELANYVIGNAGANVLDGGAGNDALQGLGGADTFAFTTALGATNVDHIADMVSGTDKIALGHGIFGGLALGALPAGAFVVGTAAGDADDRIVYNSATGELFYDADGNGAGAAVLFAVLDGHPILAASDFAVI